MNIAVNDTSLRDYYARRANEYEKIFAKPERQENLAALRTLLRNQLAGRDVLEVACGTGYWTQVISETARSILATDINEQVLEIARHKTYPRDNVAFRIADAYTLADVDGNFTAGFAGFWWSHVPKQRLREFAERFHRKLQPDALVVFLDNNYVQGSSTPISRRDEDGNTYQDRKLENGAEFEVLKNFPDADELKDFAAGMAENIEVTELKYYWFLSCTMRA